MKTSLAAVLLLSATASGFDSRVQWMKFDSALGQAGVSGKPICVYVAVNPEGSS